MTTRIMEKAVGKELVSGIAHGHLYIKDLQEKVGGYVELVSMPNDIKMWVNEDGQAMKKSLNFFVRANDETYETLIIRGDVVFTGVSEAGDIIGLTEEQEKWLRKRCRRNGLSENSKGLYKVYEITID